MKLPYLSAVNAERSIQHTFGGYNLRADAADGSFCDSLNLTSSQYPLLTVRNPRAQWHRTLYSNGGLISSIMNMRLFGAGGITAVANVNDSLCICSADKVYAAGKPVEGVTLDSSVYKKSVAVNGRNFFIAPDGKYITQNGSSYSGTDVYRRNEIFGETSVKLAYETGEAFPEASYTGAVPPDSPAEGALWLCTSSTENVLKIYTGGEWRSAGCGFVLLEAEGIGAELNKGDVVNISGFDSEILCGLHEIVFSSNNGIVIEADVCAPFIQDSDVSVCRDMPLMDFVIEHNNRIWGCRFGLNRNGEFVNEIYASRLGDPLNWFSFKGLSTDSYSVSLGCSGAFTGVAQLNRELVFFKENYIIRISGSAPAEYSVTCVSARGVEAGSENSCVNLNEQLFYKSPAGIMVYDGTIPYCISASLGNKPYFDVCAGAADGKYYAAMSDENSVRSIFVYDTLTGLWEREDDNLHVQYFIYRKNCLYMICLLVHTEADSTQANLYGFYVHNYLTAGKACNIFDDSDVNGTFYYKTAPPVEWYAQTPMSGVLTPEVSRLNSIEIRMLLPSGSSFKAHICCNNGEWREIADIRREISGTLKIPVNTGRCEGFSLKFSGKGPCTIYSVVKNYQKTSGVNADGR